MSDVTKLEQRILVVTPGNLKQGHIYVRPHYDFFPPDCFGPSRRNTTDTTKPIEITLDGLNEVVHTDFGADAKTGKPRGFFRSREWVPRFFKHHHVTAGDRLALQRIGARKYRLSIAEKSAVASRRPKAAEFFAGIGLVRLALERQGWEVVFANDIDPDKREMYLQNWPNDAHLNPKDIHTLSADEVPDCDLYTASFPCNDLSIAGKGEGLNGKESSAFWGLIKILRDKGKRRPRLVFLENVLGFLTSHRGRDFERALLALNELGYTVDALILNAIHWTPQSRVRLFVVAKRDEGGEGRLPVIATQTRPGPLLDFILAHENIRWDVQPLPALPEPTARLADIVEDLPDDDQHWWDKERAAYFFSQLSKKHEMEAREMIAAKKVSFATAFRRVRNGRSMAELRTDGVAGCLRTPRGGSGRQILFKAGGGQFQVRLLTARECARLQGVPDSYLVGTVPLNQALFGFGDAVCVPAVEWILSNYLNPRIHPE